MEIIISADFLGYEGFIYTFISSLYSNESNFQVSKQYVYWKMALLELVWLFSIDRKKPYSERNPSVTKSFSRFVPMQHLSDLFIYPIYLSKISIFLNLSVIFLLKFLINFLCFTFIGIYGRIPQFLPSTSENEVQKKGKCYLYALKL